MSERIRLLNYSPEYSAKDGHGSWKRWAKSTALFSLACLSPNLLVGRQPDTPKRSPCTNGKGTLPYDQTLLRGAPKVRSRTPASVIYWLATHLITSPILRSRAAALSSPNSMEMRQRTFYCIRSLSRLWVPVHRRVETSSLDTVEVMARRLRFIYIPVSESHSVRLCSSVTPLPPIVTPAHLSTGMQLHHKEHSSGRHPARLWPRPRLPP